MLMANSAAILTDAFPADKRGFALGINQVAGLAGQFIGLVAGGLLAAWDWRAVFWVNVPVGVFGTLWAYRKLRDNGERHRGRIDWWGNVTFAVGLGAVLIGITDGIQPYGTHSEGWTNPSVLGLLIGGLVLLAAFVVIERRVAEPMFQLSLFRIRAFTAGSVAGLVVVHRPRRAAVHADHLAAGDLAAAARLRLQRHAAVGGHLPAAADRRLPRSRARPRGSSPTGSARGASPPPGWPCSAAASSACCSCPANFPYWAFALLITANGIGSGMFAAPNSSSIMGSVPARQRGAASGMRSTFQNSGTALSIGVFFSLMIAGLAASLPRSLTSGLEQQGVPHAIAHQIGALPPVSSLFAAVLGVNPVQHLLASQGALAWLPAASQRVLTGRAFFPHLIAEPFHQGLIVVLSVAAALSALAAVASLLRGGRYVPPETAAGPGPARTAPGSTAAGAAPSSEKRNAS